MTLYQRRLFEQTVLFRSPGKGETYILILSEPCSRSRRSRPSYHARGGGAAAMSCAWAVEATDDGW